MRINGELKEVTPTWPPVGAPCLVLTKNGDMVFGTRFKTADMTIRGDAVFGQSDRTVKGADQFNTYNSSAIKMPEVQAAILLSDIWAG